MHSQAHQPNNHRTHNCTVNESIIFISTPEWNCIWLSQKEDKTIQLTVTRTTIAHLANSQKIVMPRKCEGKKNSLGK